MIFISMLIELKLNYVIRAFTFWAVSVFLDAQIKHRILFVLMNVVMGTTSIHLLEISFVNRVLLAANIVTHMVLVRCVSLAIFMIKTNVMIYAI